MTTAYWCVLAAILLPYVFTVLAKTGPHYSNRTPREYFDTVKGWRKRARWAELNTFEVLPGFIAAVIIAQQLQAPQILIDKLAFGFIAARILYGICYLTDKSMLRSCCWGLGLGCVIGLFVIVA